MRAIVLSVAVFVGLGQLVYAQNQPQTLKGVYGPPGSSALGASGKSSSGLSGLGNGPIGAAPRIMVPGTPSRARRCRTTSLRRRSRIGPATAGW